MFHFMQQQSEENNPIKGFNTVYERVALTTGTSLRRVQNIVSEVKAIEDGEEGSTP